VRLCCQPIDRLEVGVTNPGWEPRRLLAVKPELPDGATPPGTRGRILRAALGRFAEYGYHGASIRDLAGDVGINSATLYAHYPAKEDILASLIELGHFSLLAGLRMALSNVDTSATAQLTALVRAQVLMHADYPLLAMVANTELHCLSAASARPSLELREQARALLYDVLSRGVASGEFSAQCDVVLAGIAIGSMGIRVATWFGPDQPYTREEVAETFAAYALRIVGGTP
jgi:AcrR family transcriptional regulator